MAAGALQGWWATRYGHRMPSRLQFRVHVFDRKRAEIHMAVVRAPDSTAAIQRAKEVAQIFGGASALCLVVGRHEHVLATIILANIGMVPQRLTELLPAE